MRRIAPVLVAVLAIGLVGSAFAGEKLKAKPWKYDPDKTRIVESKWHDKIGLPDKEQKPKDIEKGKIKGPSNGLFLEKDGLTTANAAAGAFIDFQGTLTELGFDFDNDGWCGAGAPRFNVYTTTGAYYFLGCASGEESPAPDDPLNWTRVRFLPNIDGEFVQAFPVGTSDPLTVDTVVIGIDIVFDEGTDIPGNPGFAVLDNIDVNGTLIVGPQGTKFDD